MPGVLRSSLVGGRSIQEEAGRRGQTFDLVSHIRVRRLKWVRHVLRMEDPRFVKQALKVVFEKKQSGDLHRRGSVLMDVPKCSSFSELVALAGALVATYQGFADVTMGIGSLILGLGMVIIGEAVLRPRSLPWSLLAVAVGAILFRTMIAIALQLGLEPVDLKLATALLLLIALAFLAGLAVAAMIEVYEGETQAAAWLEEGR